jgi:hypothetical protein
MSIFHDAVLQMLARKKIAYTVYLQQANKKVILFSLTELCSTELGQANKTFLITSNITE